MFEDADGLTVVPLPLVEVPLVFVVVDDDIREAGGGILLWGLYDGKDVGIPRLLWEKFIFNTVYTTHLY